MTIPGSIRRHVLTVVAMSAPTRPGLTALVVYLRPAPRRWLLLVLAEADVYLIEHVGAANAVQTALATRSDLVIVVGGDDPEHVALARTLLETLSSVLVAVIPPGTSAAPYYNAGAVTVLTDDTPPEEAGAALSPALREARLLRSIGRLAAEYLVFKDVRFRTLPPELAREGRTVPLTRVEAEVLAELSRSLGNLVPASELTRRLAQVSRRAAVHPGYLKTVILRLRRKIQSLGADPKLLRNVRGLGYVLVG